MSRVRTRGMTAGLVISALLLVGSLATTSSAHERGGEYRGDVLASANPSAADPAVADVEVDVDAVSRRNVDTDAAATASATCDGCLAEGATLQVLYASKGRGAVLDNAAVAWSQDCRGCSAASLSVQVVLLRSFPLVQPSNRALAANAACRGCGTASAAYQVVVVAGRGERLDKPSLRELYAWFEEQRAVVRAAAAPPQVWVEEEAGQWEEPKPGLPTTRLSRRVANSALAELTEIVTDDVGGEPVTATVAMQR